MTVRELLQDLDCQSEFRVVTYDKDDNRVVLDHRKAKVHNSEVLVMYAENDIIYLQVEVEE